jgi:hypothetical protein
MNGAENEIEGKGQSLNIPPKFKFRKKGDGGSG